MHPCLTGCRLNRTCCVLREAAEAVDVVEQQQHEAPQADRLRELERIRELVRLREREEERLKETEQLRMREEGAYRQTEHLRLMAEQRENLQRLVSCLHCSLTNHQQRELLCSYKTSAV